MIGSLEITHEFIFTIPSVIQISSIKSIQLIFNLGKPRLFAKNYAVNCIKMKEIKSTERAHVPKAPFP